MSANDLVAVARRSDLTVDDVFLMERRYVVSSADYVTWWLASGGPWQSDPPRPERAVELLADAPAVVDINGREHPWLLCLTGVLDCMAEEMDVLGRC